jgi:hypothetical protein
MENVARYVSSLRFEGDNSGTGYMECVTNMALVRNVENISDKSKIPPHE